MSTIEIILTCSLIIFTLCDAIMFTLHQLNYRLLLLTNTKVLNIACVIGKLISILAFVKIFGILYGLLFGILGVFIVSFIIYYIMVIINQKDMLKLIEKDQYDDELFKGLRMYKIKTSIIIPLLYITLLVNFILSCAI